MTEKKEYADKAEVKRGIIIEIVEGENGQQKLDINPMGVEALSVPSLLKLAAKVAEQNLGL